MRIEGGKIQNGINLIGIEGEPLYQETFGGRVPGQAQVSGWQECRSEKKGLPMTGSKIFRHGDGDGRRVRGVADVRACSGLKAYVGAAHGLKGVREILPDVRKRIWHSLYGWCMVRRNPFGVR